MISTLVISIAPLATYSPSVGVPSRRPVTVKALCGLTIVPPGVVPNTGSTPMLAGPSKRDSATFRSPLKPKRFTCPCPRAPECTCPLSAKVAFRISMRPMVSGFEGVLPFDGLA